MGKFFNFIVRITEEIYEANRESLERRYRLNEILKEAPAAAAGKSVKTVQTVKKLKVQEAHNS